MAAAATEAVVEADQTLFVRLIDADTGAAVSMRASLWRLDLPETAEFTAGDVEIESTEIGAEGLAVPDLPAGRYRLHCYGQRRGADDPPAFDVDGGRTDLTALVLPPRTLTAWIQVFDETGARIERGERRRMGGCSRFSGPGTPAWATPRRRKGQGRSGRFGMGFG